MQKAYQTINDVFVNENHISMFKATDENGIYRIEIIVDYSQSEEEKLILFEGTQEERDSFLQKLMFNFFEDWHSFPDGTLIKIDHVKQIQKKFTGFCYSIIMDLGNGNLYHAFDGTKEGMDIAFDKLKNEIYSVVYDLQKI